MRRLFYFISALVLAVGFASCDDSVNYAWPDDDEGFLNQELVVINEDGTEEHTRNKVAVGAVQALPIGSVFVGGAVADPKIGSSHRCHFYSEVFTEGPNWDDVPEIISIEGFRHKGTEYTAPGQYIDVIVIRMSSLGYGDYLRIPMNQGKYEGGCEIVSDVKINSYKFSSYQSDHYTLNDDARIDIRILMNDGTEIAILFAGKTPHDRYY